MSATETFDVVVVGSGAAGAMAALRAADLGLSVIIVEKAHKYGGTSATSGGVLWVPNHQLTPNDDTPARRGRPDDGHPWPDDAMVTQAAASVA